MENKTADGKYVVVQNGQRVTGALSEQQANEEAQRLNKQLMEKQGKQNEQGSAQVKQNIYG